MICAAAEGRVPSACSGVGGWFGMALRAKSFVNLRVL
jgi:hypothetical protein